KEFWDSFEEAIESKGAGDGLIDRQVDSLAVRGLQFLGFLVVVVGAAGIALFHVSWAVLVVVGALVVVSGSAFARRSAQGALLNARWQAFKNFLHDYSRLKEAPPASVILWDHYLAYAVPLGEARTVTQMMKVHQPPDARPDGWYRV